MIPRILIVDDSEDNREVLMDALDGEGYALTQAADGVEALERVRDDPPDLILLDVMMPRMDGIECCRRLHADEGTSHIPVLLITALREDQHLVRGLDAGATDYVSKPFNGAAVRARIRAALRSKIAHDDLDAKNREIGTLVRELETRNRELAEIALQDGLTGLPNRVLLMNRLEQAIERSHHDPDYRFALLFLDFDRFKLINDTHGHEAGDELLRQIAKRLGTEVRDGDAVCPGDPRVVPTRLGGDEFVVLLEDIKTTQAAEIVGRRLLKTLAAPYRLCGAEISSTASIGIVTSEHGYKRGEDLIRDADAAMYHAKDQGRACVAVFDAEMHEAQKRRVRMEAQLRDAIDHDQLAMHYQPIFRLDDGMPAGVEAMVRWSHPEHGLLPSEAFMPVAHESGLIIPIGPIVLAQAFRQLHAWQARHGVDAPASLTVNLWQKQLQQPDLVETVRRCLDEAEIGADHIRFEVPEQVFLDGSRQALDTIDRLKSLGASLSMDGCGKGHSALTSLHSIPVDVLKIDRSVICNLDRKYEYAAIVQSVITLAHNLGMRVVAVGIETPGQLAQLQALECDWGQGQLLAPPAPAEGFDPFMHGSRRLTGRVAAPAPSKR